MYNGITVGVQNKSALVPSALLRIRGFVLSKECYMNVM